ncbi:hypothetical protein ABIB57_004639 [Devosia sp. UYZn731]|uniref:hypothetical protein n=1 Tax=Devosia sp. UYZn731 TaxID=3156345 RepID=UPI00339693B6
MRRLMSADDIGEWAISLVDIYVGEVIYALSPSCDDDLLALGFLHLICRSEHLEVTHGSRRVLIKSTCAFEKRFRCQLAISVSSEAYEHFPTFSAG